MFVAWLEVPVASPLNTEVSLLKLIRQTQESRFHNTNKKAIKIFRTSQLHLWDVHTSKHFFLREAENAGSLALFL